MIRPPTPPPDGINVNDIANADDESTESLSSPIALFPSNNNLNPSNLNSFLSQQNLPPVLADSRAKRKSNTQIATSPSRPKRPATSSTRSSPCRLALRAVVCGVASVSHQTNDVVASSQTPGRVSPPSVVQSVFDEHVRPPLSLYARTSKLASLSTSKSAAKKGGSRTMLGLIPKNEFLQEFRPRFSTKTTLTPSLIDKDLKDKRKWMNAHFQWWGDGKNKDDETVGPRLRSSNDEIDDWIIDSEGINIETTNHRRLSRYCIEQLWVTEYKTKLLVLINVANDLKMYGGLGAAVKKIQCIDRTTISGREYYRLKCTVTSSNRDKLLYGEQSGTYSRERFERDVGESRNGDFGVSFDGTTEKMLFNWYGIINSPSSLMFFGAPLTQSRSFDSLWKNVQSPDTLYARFACMFDEFEGNVEACQALYNSYLFRCLAISEK